MSNGPDTKPFNIYFQWEGKLDIGIMRILLCRNKKDSFQSEIENPEQRSTLLQNNLPSLFFSQSHSQADWRTAWLCILQTVGRKMNE